jgi:hypothetical protein
MRDTVKRWVRNYPLFDAIDVGKNEMKWMNDAINQIKQ